MGAETTNLGLYKPAYQETGWEDELNDSLDTLDANPGIVIVADDAAKNGLDTWEGRHCYQEDDDTLYYYDGASWTAVDTDTATFLGLTDAPATYTDQGSKLVAVNAGEDAVEFTDDLVGKNLEDYSETVDTEAASGAAYTIDLENGNVHDVTLTDDCTFTFSNPPDAGSAGSFTLILRQDGTGSRSVTWPGSVAWAGGTGPTLTTTANAVDILTFVTVDGGTTWYGMLAGADFS